MYKLNQNYPNPFNPQTKITFDLPKQSTVSLTIFDNLGRVIETPINDMLINAGKYEYKWDAKRFASGIYFCKLVTEKYTGTIKMILVR